MKKTTIIFAAILFPVLLIAGIYRHDVPAELYKTFANQPQFECVGEVIAKDNKGGGSCVLIGDRYVLSVAHVFIQSETVVDTTLMIGKAKVTTYKQVNKHVGTAEDYTFRFNRKGYRGKKIAIMPAYLAEATKGKCDIAVIELDEPVKDIQPAILSSSFDELHALVTGVGFGASGPASDAEQVGLFLEKIAGQNIIDSIGGYVYNKQSTLLMVDFDKPFVESVNILGDANPILLEYCVGGGDSGGPLFRQTKDGWKVIGVCSGTSLTLEKFMVQGYYGQLSIWTRVSAFNSWIETTINEMKTTAKK